MPKPIFNQPLAKTIYWDRKPKGEVGIEIEVEGGPFPEGAPANWLVHADGSLRGDFAREYVIRQPINRDRVRASLDALAANIGGHNPVFSYRTSVHVHVNVQDLTVRQWVAYLTLFGIFEEAFVNVVGPERAGNKFCLRFKDADRSLRVIAEGIRDGNLAEYLGGDLKYASCNVRATRTHGTLEFRAMRGNIDAAFIADWVATLLALKDTAKAVQAPNTFVEELSILGPREFALKYLPDNQIRRGVLGQPIDQILYRGARLSQEIAYCADWGDAPPPVAVGPEPMVDMVQPEVLRDETVEYWMDLGLNRAQAEGMAAAALRNRQLRELDEPRRVIRANAIPAGWGMPAAQDLNLRNIDLEVD